MELSPQGSLWSDRRSWDNVVRAIDRRQQHAGLGGHARWCVLDEPDVATTAEALRCTRALPACETSLGRRMRAEIERLVADNAGNQLDRHVLLLEGEATLGKTTATMFAVLRLYRTALQERGEILEGVYEHIPWVYVEVGAGWGYRDLAEAIQRFCGLPFRQRDTAQERVAHLRKMLPRLGTVGVIIDDAHNLRSRPEGPIVDGLKNMITGLPVTFIFIGLDPLAKSALLNGAAQGQGSSVQQIARRSRLISAELGRTADQRRHDWDSVVVSLVGQMHLPEGASIAVLRDGNLRDQLYRTTRGLFGGTYALLRDAAVDALSDPDLCFSDALQSAVSKAQAEEALQLQLAQPVRTRRLRRSDS